MALLEISELEALGSFFKGEKGHARARTVLKMLGVDKVEASYAAIEQYHGPEAAVRWLENQDVHYSITGFEKLQALREGPFITVSNHTIGTVDGIMLIAFMGQFRQDYKMMVNKFLERLRVLEDNFITVTPTGSERTAPTSVSIGGVRLAMEHIAAGHPLGLFPAGAVSDLHLGFRPLLTFPPSVSGASCAVSYREPRVRDREWQMPMIKFIKKAHVPVVPIRLFDGNSRFFYQLGLIDWRVRLLRQPHEVVNKAGKTFRFGIGDIITPEQQDACTSLEELRSLLRGAVYSQSEPPRE